MRMWRMVCMDHSQYVMYVCYFPSVPVCDVKISKLPIRLCAYLNIADQFI